jgi:hypothetical protein
MNIFEITLPSPSHTTLLESVCRDLTRDQRRVVEGIVNQLRPLFEAPLTQTQIDQIFSQAEQNLTGAGVNRSGVGQAVDVTKAVGSAVGSKVGSVNNAINKLGGYLQTTAPVQYFDQKFEDLKQKISTRLGTDSKTMAIVDQLGQYAKANPGKTAFVIGALTAVAAFAAGPAGGAVAGQVLRGATELLKGEKLSTAVGKGIKSGAYGFLAGMGIKELGEYLGAVEVVRENIPGYTGLAKIKFMREGTGTPFQYIEGTIPSKLYPKIEYLLNSANAAFDRGDIAGGVRTYQAIKNIVESPDMIEGVKSIAANNAALVQQAQTQAKNIGLAINSISSAAQGAVQAATGTGATKTAPAQPTAAAPATPAPAANAAPANFNQVRENHIRLTNKEVKEIFAVAGNSLNEGPLDWLKTKGKNITTKVTADKLKSMWTKDGKPMDSEKIAAILRQAGVKDDVVASAFNAVEAPVPSWVRTPAAAQPAAEPAATTAAEPAAEPAAATATQPAAGKSATAAPAMDTDRILKSYEMMTPDQRKQLIKDLEIIDDRDRLATGTNESRKRQRRI